MSYTIEDVEIIKDKAERVQRQHDQATGQLDTYMKQAREEHGLKGKDPEKLLAAIKEEEEKLEEEEEELTEALQVEAEKVETALEAVG